MTIKVRIASRAPFTFNSGAGVDLTRSGNAISAQLNYEDLAAGTVAGEWVIAAYDPVAEEYGTFAMSAALALDHEHTAAQISDGTTVGRAVLTAASQAEARSAIDAAALSHTQALATISDMSADARTFNAAADYAAMRTALGFTAAGWSMASAANAAAQTALLDAFTIDTGSGGVKGLVPAPAAGDAAAGKVLSAAGWVVPSAASLPTGCVVNSVFGAYTANADLTATIPYDDTIPQVGEGTQILSVAITPGATANKVRGRFQGFFASSVSDRVTAAVFVNGGSNAIAATASYYYSTSGEKMIAVEFEHSPSSTSAQTYTVRVGPNSAGTIRFNGTVVARRFGGVAGATLTLEEIKG